MMRIGLLMVAAALWASAAAFATNVPGVTGRWYMEGEENGVYAQYLVDRSESGKFSADIRTPKDCDRPGWIETGSWSFRDGTLYNRTETVGGQAVDSNDPAYQDSLVVTVIDDDHATIFDPKTKITWTTRRVGADFKPPALAGCAA